MSTSPSDTAAQVRAGVKELARLRPGRSVELRVPPYAAAQLGTDDGSAGPRHTRGTPPAVVELDAATFLELASGELAWADGVRLHRVAVSGAHADLSALFPLRGPAAASPTPAE
jgi:hypothetical protein